jgi:hypothetical protein
MRILLKTALIPVFSIIVIIGLLLLYCISGPIPRMSIPH